MARIGERSRQLYDIFLLTPINYIASDVVLTFDRSVPNKELLGCTFFVIGEKGRNMFKTIAAVLATLITSVSLAGNNSSSSPNIGTSSFLHATMPTVTEMHKFWGQRYTTQGMFSRSINVYTVKNVTEGIPATLRITETSQPQWQYPVWYGSPVISLAQQKFWTNKVLIQTAYHSIFRDPIYGTLTHYHLQTDLSRADAARDSLLNPVQEGALKNGYNQAEIVILNTLLTNGQYFQITAYYYGKVSHLHPLMQFFHSLLTPSSS